MRGERFSGETRRRRYVNHTAILWISPEDRNGGAPVQARPGRLLNQNPASMLISLAG
jgi:hypothetical protein